MKCALRVFAVLATWLRSCLSSYLDHSPRAVFWRMSAVGEFAREGVKALGLNILLPRVLTQSDLSTITIEHCPLLFSTIMLSV